MQHFHVHESHLKLCHLTPSHSVQILRQRMRTRGTCHSVVRRHLFGQTEMMTLPPIGSSLVATISRNADTAEVCCTLITGHALMQQQRLLSMQMKRGCARRWVVML